MAMVRTQTYITQEQSDWLKEIARQTERTEAEHIREAIDMYKALTGYMREMPDIAAEVHPEMSYEQFVGWLQFRFRLRYEGKENGVGDESLRLLRTICDHLGIGGHDYDHA